LAAKNESILKFQFGKIYFKLVCEQQNVKAEHRVVHKVQADLVLCQGYGPEKVA
jgi:hypothetical protein